MFPNLPTTLVQDGGPARVKSAIIAKFHMHKSNF